MMLIVYALSETSGGYSIFGLVIGNIIVMGIEAALVCIQALRLEFYELFGRFYTGRGEAFAPAHIDYSSPAPVSYTHLRKKPGSRSSTYTSSASCAACMTILSS